MNRSSFNGYRPKISTSREGNGPCADTSKYHSSNYSSRLASESEATSQGHSSSSSSRSNKPPPDQAAAQNMRKDSANISNKSRDCRALHSTNPSSRESSSIPSYSTSSSGAASRERLRPGRVYSLGIFGKYHCNPTGLAAYYDWDAEGGYIPFRHQGAHRKKWRQEMRETLREEKRERAARFKYVEDQKAEKRREYDAHMASRRLHQGKQEPYVE